MMMIARVSMPPLPALFQGDDAWAQREAVLERRQSAVVSGI
jgi:hypothetical protein